MHKYRELLDGRTMFVFGLGLPEVIILGIAIVALFFGHRKVGEWARGLGRVRGEFRKGTLEVDKELEEIKEKPE